MARLIGEKRDRQISVCIPARDEETTIGAIVSAISSALVGPGCLVDEILVVDDGSHDRTAERAEEAGARVVSADSVLAAEGGGHGKGQAMWRAVFEAEGDVIAFCDADVADFDPSFVTGLVGPLLVSEDIALVKGAYERTFDGQPSGGGRVTELVARPLVSVLFPQLSGVAQPLAGESAARRDVLEALSFVDGYGVELGLLIDVADRFGVSAVAEVDLGVRSHRNRSLDELGPQALSILQVALRRAGVAGWQDRPVTLARPGHEPVAVATGERPPLLELVSYRRRSA